MRSLAEDDSLDVLYTAVVCLISIYGSFGWWQPLGKEYKRQKLDKILRIACAGTTRALQSWQMLSMYSYIYSPWILVLNTLCRAALDISGSAGIVTSKMKFFWNSEHSLHTPPHTSVSREMGWISQPGQNGIAVICCEVRTRYSSSTSAESFREYSRIIRFASQVAIKFLQSRPAQSALTRWIVYKECSKLPYPAFQIIRI